jgi:hypothetical protein
MPEALRLARSQVRPQASVFGRSGASGVVQAQPGAAVCGEVLRLSLDGNHVSLNPSQGVRFMSITTETTDQTWKPSYSRWRHGGWYVDNCVYLSGAVGCVSNNYPDKKWRIVCGPQEITFPSRDAAARAEYAAIQMIKRHIEKTNPPGWDSVEV